MDMCNLEHRFPPNHWQRIDCFSALEETNKKEAALAIETLVRCISKVPLSFTAVIGCNAIPAKQKICSAPLGSHKKKRKMWWIGRKRKRGPGEGLLKEICLCRFLRRGFIALKNRTFVIEPERRHGNDTHLVYRVEKLAMTQGDCGHGFNMSSVPSEDHIRNPFRFFHARVRRQPRLDSPTPSSRNLLFFSFWSFECYTLDLAVPKNQISHQSQPAHRVWNVSQRVSPRAWHILSALRVQIWGPTQGLADGLDGAGAVSICHCCLALKCPLQSRGVKLPNTLSFNGPRVIFNL